MVVKTANMPLRATTSVPLLLFVGLASVSAWAKDKHPKPSPPAHDQIQVVAHISVTGDAVTGFLTTQHYKRKYLYAEHASGKTVTLIDITNVSSPALLAEMSDPAGGSDAFVAVAGNAALVATGDGQAPTSAPAQTFRILSFADPMHPTIQQEFKAVTAMARDDKRGLIFLSNPDGIWILQQQFAPDPEAEKEWEHMVLDAR